MATNLGPAGRARMSELWPQLLERVAAGDIIKRVYEDLGISAGMVRAWRADNVANDREWQAAREASADSFADMALDEAMSNKCGDEAAHARTRIDTLKWAARIRNPRLYSDKSQVDINVKTIDLTRIISEANARLAAARAPRILEHEGAAPELIAHAAIGCLADLT